MKKTKKKKISQTVIEWGLTILAVAIVFLVATYVVQIGRVSGRSMETTYYNGELVMINKLSKKYEYNQVITFEYSDKEEQYYDLLSGQTASFKPVDDGDFHIKRIVGLPGDSVKIEDSKLYINGNLVSESSLYIPDQSYVLEEDNYFVQGDNLDNSYDSRLHGPITKDEIYGIVMTGDTTKDKNS